MDPPKDYDDKVEESNIRPYLFSEEEEITSSSKLLRKTTENLMIERKSHHIHHMSVLDKS